MSSDVIHISSANANTSGILRYLAAMSLPILNPMFWHTSMVFVLVYDIANGTVAHAVSPC